MNDQLLINATTIAMLLTLSASLLAVAMLLVWWLERTHHGFGFWAAAQTAFGLGMLFLLSRVFLPLEVSVAFGNGGVMLAFVLLRAGFLRFRGRPVDVRFDAGVSLAVLVAMLSLVFLGASLDTRIAVILTAVSFLAVRNLLVLNDPPHRFRIIFRGLQCLFAVLALMALARAFFAIPSDTSSSTLFETTPAQTIIWMGLSAATLLLPFVLVVLNSLRNLDRLRVAQRRSEYAAGTDYVTGLANRRRLFRYLRSLPGHAPLGLCLLDLDDFKRINDRYGHAAGDRVLAEIGRILRESTPEDDIAVRMGGEEFAVIVGGAEAEQLVRLGEHLRARIEREVATRCELEQPLTASFGVASGPAGDIDGLLGRADAALYRAKRAGKNRVEQGDQHSAGEAPRHVGFRVEPR